MIAQVMTMTVGECAGAAFAIAAFAHLFDFSRLRSVEVNATKDSRLFLSIGLFLFVFVIFLLVSS